MSDIAREDSNSSSVTSACARCGTEYQASESRCQVCGRINAPIPGWAQLGRDRRRFTPRRWLLAGVIMLLIGLVTWINYPFLPDFKILVFNRPITNMSSNSLPGQWSMNGRDLAQSRYVDSPSHQPAGRVRWSRNLGESTFSAPVVVDGVIYIGGHFKVLALESETGRTIWERTATGPVDSTAAVAGDSLDLGFLDRRLVALNLETGEARWEFKTDGHITSSLVVAKGIIYGGSWDGSVYALDAATGDRIWRYETEGRVRLQPTIHEGVLFAAASDGKLHILNARTGQDRLRFRTPKSATASPAVANGMAYLPAAGTLYALDTTAKEIPGLYQFKIMWALGYVWQVPGVPRPPAQRSSLWRFAPEGSSSSIVAAPAVVEDTIFLGDLQGNFYALDALTGTELWRFQAEGGISASPVIAGDRVYFGTRDGFLYALNRFDGEVSWRLPLGASIDIAPAYSEGHIYVRTNDGLLHAIE